MSEQNQTPENELDVQEFNNEMTQRRAKLAELRTKGNPSRTISVVNRSLVICMKHSVRNLRKNWKQKNITSRSLVVS